MKKPLDAHQIVAALGGLNGKAPCPAHTDTDPSLSVTDAPGGRILVKCHAGCSQTAVIGALRKRGLWPKRSKVKKTTKETKDKKQAGVRKALAVFRAEEHPKYVRKYLRSRGIKRRPPNCKPVKFRGRHAMACPILDAADDMAIIGVSVTSLAFDASAKADIEVPRRFIGAVKGGVVPFKAKAGTEGPLLIAEGVETALSVRQITGCAAWAALSTSNMGNVVVPAKHRKIVVCADNDKPGRKAAKALAKRLAAEGRLVRLATPEKKGEDFNDMLQADNTDPKTLRKSILKAKVVRPPKKKGLDKISSTDLATLEIAPRANLIDPWLPQQGLAMIHARPGVGKTFVGLGVAFAVAYGRSFLGWEPKATGDVLYLDGEMPLSLMRKRAKQYRASFISEDRNSEYDVHIVNPERQANGMPDLGTEEGQKAIDALITQRTQLIIVDSLSTLVRTGEENTAEGWEPIQAWGLRHRANGRSVLFIHHAGKSGAQRGTSRREDVLDTVIKLERASDYSAEQGAAFDVKFEKARAVFGEAVAPFHVTLSVNDDGAITWTRDPLDQTTTSKILEFFDKNPNASQRECAETIGISEGRVSQLRKKAKDDGLI